jgi:hypothetical protein
VSAPVEQDRDAATQAREAASRARGRKTVGDMVRSLAVVLVVVGVIVALNIAEQPDPVVRDVDYPAAVALARQRATYDVLGPDPVPAGWRVSSARTERDGSGVAWHVGLVTRDGEYAAVEQTDGDRRVFVDHFVPGARATGSERVAGRTWTRRSGGSNGDRALVLRSGGVTTLVTGSASWAELRTLAESLRS